MKLRELFLNEVAMNMKTYSGVVSRLGQTAKVGFEFEMFVDGKSSLFVPGSGSNAETDSIQNYFTDDIYDCPVQIEISQRERLSIFHRYEAWLEACKKDWVDDNWEDYLLGDEDEALGRSRAEEEFDSFISGSGNRASKNKYGFAAWIKDEFWDNYSFLEHFNITPEYGWESEGSNAQFYTTDPVEDDSEVPFDQVAAKASSELTEYLDAGTNITVYDSYHEMPKNLKHWYIEPDSSISGDSLGVGIELVSPPLPLDDSLKACKTVFDWMEDFKIETNESTGLHINISIPGIENVDLVKLILFMGEKYAASVFNREKNSYAASHIDSIINLVLNSGRLPKLANDMIDQAKDILSKNKYYSVNLSTLEKGYLEFRVAGGSNYHKDMVTVKKTVMQFATALEIACSPDAEKKEYAKKLTNIFGKAEAAGTRSIEKRVPSKLKPLARLMALGKIIGGVQDLYYALITSSNPQKAFIEFLRECLNVLRKTGTPFTLQERVFIKTTAKKYGITSDILDSGLSAADRQFAKQQINL